MSEAWTVKDICWPSDPCFAPTAERTGASLTSPTVMVMVAVLESKMPSFALKVKLSCPE